MHQLRGIGQVLSLDALEAYLVHARDIRDDPQVREVGINLGAARWFDIGALLFLVAALGQLKRARKKLALRLPEASMDDIRPDNAQRARDFLKRWGTEEALHEAVGDLQAVLPPEQHGYFEPPLQHYRPSVSEAHGVREELLSNSLIEITHMTRGRIGEKTVSQDAIADYIQRLALEYRFKRAFRGVSGFDEDQYNDFVQTIIREALINTHEHPDASISMIAMALQEQHDKRELVVAIADNGLTIPATIEEHAGREPQPFSRPMAVEFRFDPEFLRLGGGRIEAYKRRFEEDTRLALYAMSPGATSRRGDPTATRGFGLTYVLESVLSLGGEITVRTGAASLRFRNADEGIHCSSSAVSFWDGNLIVVKFPITQPQV